MKITESIERFRKEWRATGIMMPTSPTSMTQTYEHDRFPGLFVHKKVNSPFGEVIELTEITK